MDDTWWIDPQFHDGEIVRFGIYTSLNKDYMGTIKGISSKHVLTHYIVEVNPDYLQYVPGYQYPVFSEQYPFTCLTIQHNFIERI